MPSERRLIAVQPDLSVSSAWTQTDSSSQVAAVLAHGAGAGMDHEFMVHFYAALAAAGISCVRFNFPYVERGRKAPDRPPLLEKTFRAILAAIRSEWNPTHLLIGGKSMGGRMASHLASQGEDVDGLFLLGYPLHPPGKPDRMRREHLASIRCPCLFVQGTRDNLCRLDLLQPEIESMQAPVDLFVVDGGNHSFLVPARLGKTKDEVRQEILDRLVIWIKGLTV